MQYSRLQDLRNRRNEDSAQINLSALIDMMFILLIFFIVTAVFVEDSGLAVEKPKALSAEKLEPSSTYIFILPSGDISLDGQNVNLDQIRSVLARLENSKIRNIVVQADPDTSARTLVRVLDEARLAGAVNISIATEKISE